MLPSEQAVGDKVLSHFLQQLNPWQNRTCNTDTTLRTSYFPEGPAQVETSRKSKLSLHMVKCICVYIYVCMYECIYIYIGVSSVNAKSSKLGLDRLKHDHSAGFVVAQQYSFVTSV